MVLPVSRPRKRGFTLVELLVVIGIIGVLLGILLPALNGARRSAQLTQCQSNLRQWGFGFQMYVDESHGYLPLRVPDGSQTEYFGPSLVNPIPGYPSGLDDMSIYFNAIPSRMIGKSYYQLLLSDASGQSPLPASGGASMFICPASFDAAAVPGSGDLLFPGNPSFFALYGTDSTGTLMSATTPALFKANMSYVYNQSLMNPPVATLANPNPPIVLNAKMSQIPNASAVVIITEKLSADSEYLDPGVQEWAAGAGFLASSISKTTGYTSKISPLKANWKTFAARHHGGGNLLFADGHVAYYRWPDVQLYVKPNPVPTTKPNPELGDSYNANSPEVIWCPWGPVN